MDRNARREGWFPALLTRYWQILAYTDLIELFDDCSQKGTVLPDRYRFGE
jgi:hypothetical protein